MSIHYNKYHENLLKKWAQMSKTYSIMHSLCAQYFSKWNKRLGIPVVIFGGLTASSIFSTTPETKGADVWRYVNGSLTLIMTALAGVSKFLNIDERTHKHQTASNKYNAIGMDIDTILSFPRGERTFSPQEFISDIKSRMLEISENAPNVATWVMSDYLNKLDKGVTNVKSKINKNIGKLKPQVSYIEAMAEIENGPVIYTDERSFSEADINYRPGSAGSTASAKREKRRNRRRRKSISIVFNRTPPSIPDRQLLSDFTDKNSRKMVMAGLKIKKQTSFDGDETSEIDSEDHGDKTEELKDTSIDVRVDK
jgi:hypothetical protein